MKNILGLLAIAGLTLALNAAVAAPLRIAVVVKAKESTYWNVVHAGVEKGKADLAAQGVEVAVLWDGPATEDLAEQQRDLVMKYVDQKVDAIVLAPSHAQVLVPAVEKAKAANIPVVIIDSLISSDIPVTTVATNNYKAGFLAGRRLAEMLEGKGNVALFRFMKGHGSSQPREAGFLDAMKKSPGIKVVSSDIHAGPTTAEALLNATSLLQKFGGELNGVFASNLYSTEGMLGALRESGLAGKVVFFGFDSTDAFVQALRQGHLHGLTVQQPFLMGSMGVESAAAAAQHKPIDKEVDTDVKVVTKENVDTPEVQRLLNP